ncbi:MAG: hypothetical protein IJ832_06040 [Bacteroidaceae bacterium]|nr:hypothetical protein [Bacteroidaceae bacterium]
MDVKCGLKKAGGALKGRNVVYAEPVNYSTISADAFVEYVRQNCQVGEAQVRSVMAAMVEQLLVFLTNGHRVTVPNLGSFMMKLKSEVGKDKNGKPILKNARFGGLRFIPGKKFSVMLKQTKFGLMSDYVREVDGLSDENAKELARLLCEWQGFFLIADFRREARVSYTYARKVVNKMLADGFLTMRRSGQLCVYSLAQGD